MTRIQIKFIVMEMVEMMKLVVVKSVIVVMLDRSSFERNEHVGRLMDVKVHWNFCLRIHLKSREVIITIGN